MFDSLSDRFEGIFKKLRGKGRLTEADVDEVLREIRTGAARGRRQRPSSAGRRPHPRAGVGEELSQALDPAQQVIKIVNDELTAMLGGETLKITFASKPATVVLMAGLQGSGKTTNSAKLARWFKAQGRQPLLVGADLQRRPPSSSCGRSAARSTSGVFSEPGDPVARAAAGWPRPAASAATCSSSTPPAASPSTPR
jgi:signal recognition particle subunit SRP54